VVYIPLHDDEALLVLQRVVTVVVLAGEGQIAIVPSLLEDDGIALPGLNECVPFQ
jgi:hypothetical protein